MKTYTRDGETYMEHQGSECKVEQHELVEKIRQYQKDWGVSLEDATMEVVGEHDEMEADKEIEGTLKQGSTVYALEGVEEDKEIQEYMKANDCDYEEAFEQVYSRKTKDGSKCRFQGESKEDEIVLKDNDSGQKTSFKKSDINDYAREHNCDLIEAEKQVYSQNIARLKTYSY